jgi:hypothetical protein
VPDEDRVIKNVGDAENRMIYLKKNSNNGVEFGEKQASKVSRMDKLSRLCGIDGPVTTFCQNQD